LKLTLSLTALVLTTALAGSGFARIIATVPNDDYSTVQVAIDAAAAEADGGIITVKRGTYSDALTLRSGVTVQGQETAQTIFRGGITAEGGSVLLRCTVAGQGAVISGGQGIEIRGSIFRDISGVALNLQSARDATIANNTFHNNGTALTVGASSGLIQANLFRNNGTAVDWDNATGISFEVNFFDRQDQDPTQDTTADRDPLLVAPGSGDFHLALGSPCIDGAGGAGIQDPDNSDADQGAYGGPDSDSRPFPVAGLTVQLSQEGTTATLNWNANLAYSITGYGVYYGPTSAYKGSGADNGNSPLQVGTATTLEITGLTVDSAAPPAPENLQAFAGSGSVFLSWNAAQGAAGYRVIWGPADGAQDQTTDVGPVTSRTVSGLTNGQAYRFAVQSYGGTTHHFAVSALDSGRSTGSTFESTLSNDVAAVASQVDGGTSAEVSQTPEEIAGFPSLDDKGGCFLRAVAPDSGRVTSLWVVLALLSVAAICFEKNCRSHCFLLFLAIVVGLPAIAGAEGPRWSLSAKGGVFVPGEENWGDHYDDNAVLDWRVGLGFRPWPRIELGVEGGYHKFTGTVDTTQSGQPLGRSLDQTLKVLPVQAFVVYDFRSKDDQFLVPYVGLGYSRYYYRHDVDEGDEVRGNQHGYHARGGLKLLLNRVDPTSAQRARTNLGLARTYACIEGQYARVDDFGSADADLGGWSILAGASLDF